MGAFKAYDFRGIFGKDFDLETIYKFGFFLPSLLHADKVLIGRDMRLTSDDMFHALARGITDAGADVYDMGLTTTPMVYYFTAKHGFPASVMITASHNPKEYNGLKVSRKDALPVGFDTGLGELEQKVLHEKVVITFAEPIPDEGIQLNAESDTDGWSGTQIAGLTKGASKVTAYFSAKPGVNIKSIGFYYSWNSKQGTDDQTTLKIAKAELVKKAGTSTGINTVQNLSSKENATLYTLSGQRVSTPVKGINIIGGKKIVIK